MMTHIKHRILLPRDVVGRAGPDEEASRKQRPTAATKPNNCPRSNLGAKRQPRRSTCIHDHFTEVRRAGGMENKPGFGSRLCAMDFITFHIASHFSTLSTFQCSAWAHQDNPWDVGSVNAGGRKCEHGAIVEDSPQFHQVSSMYLTLTRLQQSRCPKHVRLRASLV